MLQLLAVEPAVADIEYAAGVSQLEASEFYHIYLRKKDCTVSQPGSPKLKQPIKEIDCTYKYV